MILIKKKKKMFRNLRVSRGVYVRVFHDVYDYVFHDVYDAHCDDDHDKTKLDVNYQSVRVVLMVLLQRYFEYLDPNRRTVDRKPVFFDEIANHLDKALAWRWSNLKAELHLILSNQEYYY